LTSIMTSEAECGSGNGGSGSGGSGSGGSGSTLKKEAGSESELGSI